MPKDKKSKVPAPAPKGAAAAASHHELALEKVPGLPEAIDLGIPEALRHDRRGTVSYATEQLQKRFGTDHWLPEFVSPADETALEQKEAQKLALAALKASGALSDLSICWKAITFDFLSPEPKEGEALSRLFRLNLHNLSLLSYLLAIPGELELFREILSRTEELPADLSYYLNFALTCWQGDSDEKLSLLADYFRKHDPEKFREIWVGGALDCYGKNLLLRTASLGRAFWLGIANQFIKPEDWLATAKEPKQNAVDLALCRAYTAIASEYDSFGEAVCCFKFQSAVDSLMFLMNQGLGLKPTIDIKAEVTPRWMVPRLQSMQRYQEETRKVMSLKETAWQKKSAAYETEIKRLASEISATRAVEELLGDKGRDSSSKQIKKLQSELRNKDSELKILREQLVAEQEKVRGLSEVKQKQSSVLDDLKDNISRLTAEINALRSDNRKLNEALILEQESRLALVGFHEMLEVQKAAIQRQNDALRHEITALKETLNVMKKPKNYSALLMSLGVPEDETELGMDHGSS